MAKRPRSADAIAAEAERLQARMQELKAEKRERARIERTREQKQRTRVMMVAAGELAAMVPVTALDMDAWAAFLARHADEVAGCATHPEWETQDAYDAANAYARARKAAGKAAGGRPKAAAWDAAEMPANGPVADSAPRSPLDVDVEPQEGEATPENGSDDEDGPAIDCMGLDELLAESKRARAEGRRANSAGEKALADGWYDYARAVEAEAEKRRAELAELEAMNTYELKNHMMWLEQQAHTADLNGNKAEYERLWAQVQRLDEHWRGRF